MANVLKEQQITKNITLSLLAQIISLSVSFVLSLIVPRFIDEYQYAFWHTFLLYVNYVGILHFGLLDGIVLRYSQYDYEEINKTKIRSQFVALLIINSIAWLILIFVGVLNSGLTKTITILVAFGILTKNIFTYNSYLFQITNRINKYALVVIVQRLVYVVIVAILIVFHQQNFIWFCIADLSGDLAGILLSYFSNKELHFGKLPPLSEILHEAKLNISTGILLMIANWSALLLVSGAKMIIEWKWGTLIFGKTSLAFSVANLVLAFVTAISIVLFPSLKRMKPDNLPTFYKRLRGVIAPILFWGLLLYYPECWILEKWLPRYSSSLVYLGLLSPIVVYMSIVSLLTNNYLKAYRYERILLVINVLSVLIAAITYSLSAYYFKSLTFMLISVVLVIMIRSIVSEIFVAKLISISLKKDIIIEFCMTCTFLVSAQFFNKLSGFFFYFSFLIAYSFFYLENIKKVWEKIFALGKTYTCRGQDRRR